MSNPIEPAESDSVAHFNSSGGSTALHTPRPIFRNIHIFQILRYRLPLAGIISILHRVSGLLLFLLLPLMLCLFEKSLTSENSFDYLQSYIARWPVKLILLVMIWAYLHHFFAGLRHLALDVHIGLNKHTARYTSLAVLVTSLLLTAGVAFRLFEGRL